MARILVAGTSLLTKLVRKPNARAAVVAVAATAAAVAEAAVIVVAGVAAAVIAAATVAIAAIAGNSALQRIL